MLNLGKAMPILFGSVAFISGVGSTFADDGTTASSASVSCPKHPERLMKGRLGGTTKLDFRILTDGSLADVKVTESSGDPELDAIAAVCALKWRYKPVTHDGHPVEVPWKAQVIWMPHS